MHVVKNDEGKYVVLHQGKVVVGLLDRGPSFMAGPFDTQEDAESWADTWIDDQVFDSDDEFSPELEYSKGN